jgi:hypothetical protein
VKIPVYEAKRLRVIVYIYTNFGSVTRIHFFLQVLNNKHTRQFHMVHYKGSVKNVTYFL